jgi:hypothetical protein
MPQEILVGRLPGLPARVPELDVSIPPLRVIETDGRGRSDQLAPFVAIGEAREFVILGLLARPFRGGL